MLDLRFLKMAEAGLDCTAERIHGSQKLVICFRVPRPRHQPGCQLPEFRLQTTQLVHLTPVFLRKRESHKAVQQLTECTGTTFEFVDRALFLGIVALPESMLRGLMPRVDLRLKLQRSIQLLESGPQPMVEILIPEKDRRYQQERQTDRPRLHQQKAPLNRIRL